jgi:hypothetical protein
MTRTPLRKVDVGVGSGCNAGAAEIEVEVGVVVGRTSAAGALHASTNSSSVPHQAL